VSLSQALLGFLVTAPPSVCVPDVIGVSAVWIQNQKKKREYRSIRSGASGLPYYCAPLVYVFEVIESLAVWWHTKPKTKNQNLIVFNKNFTFIQKSLNIGKKEKKKESVTENKKCEHEQHPHALQPH